MSQISFRTREIVIHHQDITALIKKLFSQALTKKNGAVSDEYFVIKRNSLLMSNLKA